MDNTHRLSLLSRSSLLALLLSLATCTPSWSPPPPPPGQPLQGPPPPRAVSAAITPKPPETFSALRDRIISEWIRDDPSRARHLGLHQLDGKVEDYSRTAIQKRLARLQRDKDSLAAIDRASLSPDEALDLDLLMQQIELTLFFSNDIEVWKRHPQYYQDLFGVNDYLDRDYAPAEERAKRLLEHEKAALAQTPHILQNLSSPMPKPVIEVAIKIYEGYASYLRNDVVGLLKGVGDTAFQQDFAKTNAALADEAEKLAKHLKTVELPKGDSSHILGEERYKKLLMVQERLTIPLSEFKAMGEENLAQNKAAYEKLNKKVRVTRATPDKLLAQATQMVEQARKFIVDNKLVTIPSGEQAIVKETPPYMRWNAAFLNSVGPFEEKGREAFYYITLPNSTWTKAEQQDYIMPKGSLLATTVHETYPGHFLHGLWIRKAKTNAQKIFGTYSFVEGWAHYTEQMMIEEGFGKDDPQSHHGQLSDALLRNCRYVVSLGVHVEGMTLEQAEKRFTDDCYQDKATAREQAVRATFDPGYFAYTLGKIQILKLREEAKTALGNAFSLRQFHDALLSYGSPPIYLIRDRVMADLKAAAAKTASK